MVAALVLVVTAAACDPPPPENAPYWLPGTTVDASLHGAFVRIEWDAPQGGDPVAAYQINLGTPNGTGVALVPASVRDCIITGLAANTAYTIVVTARDAQMHWSGPLSGTQGNRKTTITTINQAGPGSLGCHRDNDGDSLPDPWETNDGSYTGMTDAGTDPTKGDTDNDGVPDGEEVLGTGVRDWDKDGIPDVADGRGSINLVAMGARPTHKDIFVEMDWTSTPGCPTGYRPTAAAISALRAPFTDAPITNPDGTTGINLIVDYGQGGVFAGGNAITHDGSPIAGVLSDAYLAFRDANFDAGRSGVFRYGLSVGSGNSNAVTGTWLMISGDCARPAHDQAAHLMHELGHTLSLAHGRKSPETAIAVGVANQFPNYNSVMNYAYPEGVDTDCDGDGFDDLVLDYSHGTNAPLDESDLDESAGICNGVDIDWDNDGIIESSVQVDINHDTVINFPHFEGEGYDILRDFDDWARVDERGMRCIRICDGTLL
ncbi:MAG TPA: fibronectin type III domain-containing protein [Acidimicrobiales bacterium]|nr:fibronectin type III domain-containing protein [Acidimicrobiales bacterium]